MKFPLTAVLTYGFLKIIVHIPDLPLTPFGDFKVGMGLWNYKMITVLLESIIFFGGVYIYAKSTKAITAQGRNLPEFMTVNFYKFNNSVW